MSAYPCGSSRLLYGAAPWSKRSPEHCDTEVPFHGSCMSHALHSLLTCFYLACVLRASCSSDDGSSWVCGPCSGANCCDLTAVNLGNQMGRGGDEEKTDTQIERAGAQWITNPVGRQ